MSFPDLIQTENPLSNKQLQVVNRVKSPPREEKDGEGLRCVLFCFFLPLRVQKITRGASYGPNWLPTV